MHVANKFVDVVPIIMQKIPRHYMTQLTVKRESLSDQKKGSFLKDKLVIMMNAT